MPIMRNRGIWCNGWSVFPASEETSLLEYTVVGREYRRRYLFLFLLLMCCIGIAVYAFFSPSLFETLFIVAALCLAICWALPVSRYRYRFSSLGVERVDVSGNTVWTMQIIPVLAALGILIIFYFNFSAIFLAYLGLVSFFLLWLARRVFLCQKKFPYKKVAWADVKLVVVEEPRRAFLLSVSGTGQESERELLVMCRRDTFRTAEELIHTHVSVEIEDGEVIF